MCSYKNCTAADKFVCSNILFNKLTRRHCWFTPFRIYFNLGIYFNPNFDVPLFSKKLQDRCDCSYFEMKNDDISDAVNTGPFA